MYVVSDFYEKSPDAEALAAFIRETLKTNRVV